MRPQRRNVSLFLYQPKHTEEVDFSIHLRLTFSPFSPGESYAIEKYSRNFAVKNSANKFSSSAQAVIYRRGRI